MKILIVEDERLISLALSRMIEGLGHTVLAAVPSAELALKSLEAGRADLILMDIRLEGPMDGIEAAGQIQGQWDIPLVFTSAYTDPDTRYRANATNPFAFLPKPISEASLKAVLDALSPMPQLA